jgi:hypothetical protein
MNPSKTRPALSGWRSLSVLVALTVTAIVLEGLAYAGISARAFPLLAAAEWIGVLAALGVLLRVVVRSWKRGGPESLRWISACLLSHADGWEAHRTTRRIAMSDWMERLGLTTARREYHDARR